ncbi:MAG: hypothetical protein ACKVE4_10840 [Dissulfuribacterales bacterium]
MITTDGEKITTSLGIQDADFLLKQIELVMPATHRKNNVIQPQVNSQNL